MERYRRCILKLILFHVKYVIKAIIPPTSRGSTAVCHLPRGILSLLKRTGGIILYTFVLGRKTRLIVKKRGWKPPWTENMVETPRGPERFFPQKFRQPTNKFEEFFEGFYRLVQLGSTEFLLSRDSEKGVDSVHKDNLGSREKRPPYFFVCAILLTVWKKEPSLPQRLSRVVKCNKCRSVTRFRNWIFNEPGSQLPSTITRRSVFETSKEFRDVIIICIY